MLNTCVLRRPPGITRSHQRFANWLRVLGLLSAVVFSSELGAQVPQAIFFLKIGYHDQTSATVLRPRVAVAVTEVHLTDPTGAATTMALQKPGGAIVKLVRYDNTTFVSEDYFPNEAELTAAYPDGTYQLSVVGGAFDTVTPFAIGGTTVPPVKVTNFAELQASGPTAHPVWEPIPAAGTGDAINLRLLSAGNVILSSETMPSARVTTGTLNNLLPTETYIGSLTYFNYTITTANNGQTDVAIGGGFTLGFPVLRGAATPAAPATPIAAGAFASGPTEITLTWQPPTGTNPPSGYILERATDRSFQTDLFGYQFTYAPSSFRDTRVAADTTYFYRLFATNAAGTSAPTSIIEVKTPAAEATGATHFVNIATRAYCGVGNNVTIGGFVVSGSAPKRVLVRAVGPSLTAQGIGAAEALADPTMTLYGSGSTVVGTNDNWSDNANRDDITAVASQIGAAALLASDNKSSALLVSLQPGVYTFVVTGNANTSGIVLLEVYDADASGAGANFVNIATRAYSTVDNGVTIGGFVVGGGAPKNVLLRAVGPTLATYGIAAADVLADPVIELHKGAPVIASNDNWISAANGTQIQMTGERIGAAPFAQDDTQSSALLVKLPPGVYSFIARGKANASGIVLVEVYDAD